jgi:molybdopterin/thiamine biosynthesis adenylyltransferase
MTGLIASIQAMEAVRYLVGHEIGLKNRLLIVNADTMDFYKVKLTRREDCTACGDTFVPRPVNEVCETQVEITAKGANK